MSNPEENDIATYVLFGDEAVSIYRVSIKHLLKAEDVKYAVGRYVTVKSFFEEKEKWKNYIEIDYPDYVTLKKHLDTIYALANKKKSFFSFLKLFK